MKEIVIALGLAEDATEKQAAKAVSKLKKEFDALGVDVTVMTERGMRAENALAEAEKEIAVATKAHADILAAQADGLEKIDALESALAMYKPKPASTEDIKKELAEKANEVMTLHSLSEVYMTSDGTPFFAKESANAHGLAAKLDVLIFHL